MIEVIHFNLYLTSSALGRDVYALGEGVHQPTSYYSILYTLFFVPCFVNFLHQRGEMFYFFIIFALDLVLKC